MADTTKREISGFIISAEKFAQHCSALASPTCTSTHLRLFHNEPIHTKAILQALSSNTSVTHLDIYELDPASATALGALLSATPRLTSLALHNLHGREAAANLAAGLAANRTLTCLHFSQLDSHAVTALSGAIAAWAPKPQQPDAHDGTHARLSRLRLEKCSINAAAAGELAAALGSQGAALRRLEVVDGDLGDAGAAALLGHPAWGQVAQLVSLDLTSAGVGRQGAEQLGRFLASSSTLECLLLHNNPRIGCAGASSIAAGLASSTSLLRLDLSSCGVGTPGGQALAAALCGAPPAAAATGPHPRPPLQHLCLNNNALGAAGLQALLQGPLCGPTPCHLLTLQLDYNLVKGLELVAAMGFAYAPPAAQQQAGSNSTAAAPPVVVSAPLEQLSLAHNSLYDAGAALLAACLAGCGSLEQLDLRENGVSDAGVTCLLPLLGPAGQRRPLSKAAAAALAGEEPASAGGAAAAGGACLQGLLLDGNRIHNIGAQVLLAAVNDAPGLWRFSAEGNKLTDPALKASLTQLSQLRAARHSQLVVLGRQLSSSSSEDGSPPAGTRRGPSRSSTGGGDGGGRANGTGNANGGAEGGGAAPMDCDGPAPSAPGAMGGAGGGGGDPQGQHQQQQHHHHQVHKHTWDDCMEGDGGSSGDDVTPHGRNVVPRGLFMDHAESPRNPSHADPHLPDRASIDMAPGARGGGTALGMGGACHMDVPCRPGGASGSEDGGGWCPDGFSDGGGAGAALGHRACDSVFAAGMAGLGSRPSHGGSSGCCHEHGGAADMCGVQLYGSHSNASSAASSRACAAGLHALGACASAPYAPQPGSLLCVSPTAPACYGTAMATGVGGAGSVPGGRAGERGSSGGAPHGQQEQQQQGAARGGGGAGAGACAARPQQLLPANRRPRYKPLTPEQQALFADF